MIYVASSWRNERHGEVVQALRAKSLDVYDFKEPSTCFKWNEVSPIDEHGGVITPQEYFTALTHPRAQAGFRQDMDHLVAATTVILVLPAGPSAHLELGYAVGRGRPTAILLDDPVRNMDLMHLACQNLYSQLDLLVAWAARQESIKSSPQH